ncbi:MAG: efflux RND transporter permease subunit [Myxococcaceae bacterium]|nr:efflux RND transporter permease subunit [Myxococcaceae bacterium]
MWLTRLALRNPVLILMMSLMTIVLGWVSLSRLPVDLFPTIDVPNVRVAVFYSGAGPEDVEKAITMPIERAVSAAPGIDRVESTSKQGVSLVTAWFQYGTNLDNAQFEVQQRIGQIANTLPPGVGQPLTLKFDITNIPVVQLAVTSDELDEKQLYDLALNTIEPQIERLPGVASAVPGGGRTREIQVLGDVDALRARDLSMLDLVGAVRSSNLLLPSGSLRTETRDYNVFTNTQVGTLEEIRDVVVKPPRGEARAVRVRDVAQVADGASDQTEVVRVNGQRGVYLRVLKQPGANTIAVVDAVRNAMGELRGIPPNVKLAISFDQSTYIRNAVSALQHEALQGGLFAVVVILVFLLSLRATGIVAVAIPLSVVATFVLLYFTGQTLNIFTLGGLALGVGRLVDDSIVELENIHRHLGMGQPRRAAVLAAAQEVALPILVSTITTIVVFFPVLFLQGVARNLFVPLALTISFSLLMSFFVSRTVTPLLCLYWLKPGHPTNKTAKWVEHQLNRMDHAYASVLERVLKHRLLTVAVILVFAAAALLFAGRRVGTEFFPKTDESQIGAGIRAPIGTRTTKTEDIAKVVEDTVTGALGRQGEGAGTVRTMLSNVGLPQGRSGLFSDNSGPHAARVNINLSQRIDRSYSDMEAVEKVRKALGDKLPGIQVFFNTGGIVGRIINFGSSAPIDVEILGYDFSEGQAHARAVAAAMKGLVDAQGRPLLTDVQISREENYPELDVEVDREKAGVLGLSQQTIAQTVLATLSGSNQFAPIPFSDPETGNEYFINVRAADPHRSHVTDLADVPVRTPEGRLVTLSTVADVRRTSGPVTVSRKYLQRAIDVTANVALTTDLGAAAAATQAALDELPPPDGFTVRLSGQAQAQKDAFAGLGFSALLAIVLVYMVLASQFKSLIDPLVIMFSVPLGVSGVFLMLWATGTTLSVNSFMGIIMMIGIVVSNGVLLVDFANVLRRRGRSIHDATIEAGRTRLRPILMTTIATLVGLAPMALGIGEGSETNLPLARAVIGGLGVSTVLTLFLVPVLYTALDRFAKRDPEEHEDEEGAHA